MVAAVREATGVALKELADLSVHGALIGLE